MRTMNLLECICDILLKGGVFLLLQTRTAKLRIFPNSEQAVFLREAMSAYTSACNYVSDLIGSGKVKADKYRVHDAGYRQIRFRFSLPSQMAQSVIRTVFASLKTIESNMRSHPEKFRKKNGSSSQRAMPMNRGTPPRSRIRIWSV